MQIISCMDSGKTRSRPEQKKLIREWVTLTDEFFYNRKEKPTTTEWLQRFQKIRREWSNGQITKGE